MQRELVAEVHPPDFSQHFHADHPVFSCSKSEQKQLNTWVSFRSAATSDEPHGMAIVVVASLLTTLKVQGKKS
ncbi:hypothetical protein [Pseudomonas lini]